MPSIDNLTVSVFYYDTENTVGNKPREIAQRCCAEIMALGEQLNIISGLLNKALRQKEIEDVVRLCHLHYEDLLFRLYALRERAWDVLAALTGTPRKATGNDRFRAEVLSKIKTAYPELEHTFRAILDFIDADIKLRNVATHKTFLIIGLTGEGASDIWEFDAMLLTFDPESEAGVRMQKAVRKSLKEFVAQQIQHTQKVSDLICEFSKQCNLAIPQKRWYLNIKQ